MGAAPSATIHATAVLVGPRALLIRGAAGAGKSSLALRLIHAADTGQIRFARLVGDDRVHVEAVGGVLLVRPADALAGLIEVRGLGVWRLPFEPVAAVGWVADLAAGDGDRMPHPSSLTTTLDGIGLPRLPVAPEADPFLPVLMFLSSPPGSRSALAVPT